MTDLTPVQLINGRHYKREDLHRLPSGVNGAKLRACRHLISTARAQGYRRVISAASVLSPQSAMAAVLAAEYGMRCTVVVGGTREESALKHPSIATAARYGADFVYAPVGYNPALQRAARDLHEADPSSYWLRYGITAPPDSTDAELSAFHRVGAQQVDNLPPQVETLVIPFGSGNTATSVLYGLALYLPLTRPDRLVLVGIGPDKREWMAERLARLGVTVPPYEHLDLHGSGYARYGDRMPATLDGIRMHPTYEGKVVRYLDGQAPDWWIRRDGKTCLWIVGGPLP